MNTAKQISNSRYGFYNALTSDHSVQSTKQKSTRQRNINQINCNMQLLTRPYFGNYLFHLVAKSVMMLILEYHFNFESNLKLNQEVILCDTFH